MRVCERYNRGCEHEEEASVEEEVVEAMDPKPEIEDSCKPRCVKQLISYEACVKRIEEDENGQKHCTGQYFDYWGCIDQCAAPKLFRKIVWEWLISVIVSV